MAKLEPLKQIKNIETGKKVKLNLCEVSKSVNCECGKEYTDRDKEHGMCHKCWQEIKESN